MDSSISGAESAARHVEINAPTYFHAGGVQENSSGTPPLLKEKRLADLPEALRLNESLKFLRIKADDLSEDIDGCDDMQCHADLTAGSPPGTAIPVRAISGIPTFTAIPVATATPRSHVNPGLATLNNCDATEFCNLLKDVYYRPWITQRVAAARPFTTVMALKFAFRQAVKEASDNDKLYLIRAYPELAGSATIAGTLSAESNFEQTGAGLKQCTPDEFATLQTQNANYHQKFGFPLVLALRGLQENGLSLCQRVIVEFKRRLQNSREVEIDESLQQIHLIAEFRLDDRIDQPDLTQH